MGSSIHDHLFQETAGCPTNVVFLEFDGQAHNIGGSTYRALTLMVEFLNEPDTDLDDACLEDLF